MAGATMHYWQLHIGDWSKSCGHLSASETGFYVRLLNVYYDTEQPIPADIKTACRLVGARTAKEREETISILREFFTMDGDGWHNKRADSEINRLRAIGEKRSSAAAKRWHSESSANAMQMHTTSNALQDSKTPRLQDSNQEPVAPPAESARQRAKQVTLKTWLANLPEGEEVFRDDDPLFQWAEAAMVPAEYVELAWSAFRAKYLTSAKKYVDWRATFRNAVRENWLKLWWIDGNGDYQLTTAGKQAQRVAA